MKATVRTLVTAALFSLVVVGTATAQDEEPAKTALLIANSEYTSFGRLSNPVPEARELAAALESIGFQTHVVVDAGREEMLDAIYDFEQVVRDRGGIALFHYGGHGVQVDGDNFLIPATADIPDERRVVTRAVDVKEIMSGLDASGAETNIVILDACRNNPLPETSGRSAARGLSVVGFKPRNSLVVYSAQPGKVAIDGLFTPTLTRNITTPGASITEVLQQVRREVSEASGGEQLPGNYDELLTPVYLASRSQPEPTVAVPEPAQQVASASAPTITVRRSTGSLVVTTEVAGSLVIDGTTIVEMSAGERIELDNIVTGDRSISVVDDRGDTLASRTVRVTEDQTATVTVAPDPVVAQADAQAARVAQQARDEAAAAAETERSVRTSTDAPEPLPAQPLSPPAPNRALRIGAWGSIAAGAVSAGVGVLSYFAGANAYEQYQEATTADEAEFFRRRTSLFANLFMIGISVGAGGLVTGPVLLMAGE